MKQIVCLFIVCISCLIGKGQPLISGNPPLFITTHKTTTLIFPSAIRHVDRGTQDILVQEVKDAENLLLIKAAAANLRETNLSVITKDGQVYCFNVCYDSLPLFLVYRCSGLQAVGLVKFKNEVMNEVRMGEYGKSILNNKRSIRGVRSQKWDMIGRVNGIYIKAGVMFFQLVLKNQSAIDYDLESLRFYIRDKKKSKRTASQEIELQPLNTVGNTRSVKGYGDTHIVAAFEKFTIPEAKFLAVEVMEKNGGRHLTFRVGNNKIIKAKPIADLD